MKISGWDRMNVWGQEKEQELCILKVNNANK